MQKQWHRTRPLTVLLLATHLSCGQEPQENSPRPEITSPGGALTLAEGVDGPVVKTLAAISESLLSPEDGVYYYHSDRINNIAATTNGTGLVSGRVSYRPSGESRETVGHIGEYGFTGQELDASSGLHHFKHRYLDTWKAGWASTDPLFALVTPDKLKKTGQAINRYTYTEGRLVTAFDESGLIAIVWDPDRTSPKDSGSRMIQSVSGSSPHELVASADIGSYKDVTEVALLGHTSYDESSKTRTMKIPLGDKEQVSPQVAAGLVNEAFPKATTVVLMGCYTARKADLASGADSFLEAFGKELKALKTQGQSIMVIGGNQVVAPERQDVYSQTGRKIGKTGTGRALGGVIYKATGGRQTAISGSKREEVSKKVFRNKR